MDINTTRLRCTLGWLAMLLPWLSAIFSVCCGYGWPGSISITYYQYETAAPALLIILGAASILLFAYKGYEKIDDILNTCAGIFGLGILLFPTAPDFSGHNYIGTFQIPASVSTVIHLICAIIFFALLSINSLFLFTKSSGDMTKEKKKRNIVFRVCGIGMVASFGLLPLSALGVSFTVWLVEAIALLFFGISWLTKANCYPWLFADKK